MDIETVGPHTRFMESHVPPNPWRHEPHWDIADPGYLVYLPPEDNGIFGSAGDVAWATHRDIAAWIAYSRDLLPRMTSAFEVVLQIHYTEYSSVDDEAYCGGCGHIYFGEVDDYCPTIKAFHLALKAPNNQGERHGK